MPITQPAINITMNDERTRRLLASLGLTPEDLPEPVPPTAEEVHRRVQELLDKDKATSAARELLDWGELALAALRESLKDSSFLERASQTEELHAPLRSAVGLLCKWDPAFIVEHIERLSTLPPSIVEACVEVAFEHSASSLVPVLDRLITSQQQELVQAALVGIRRAVFKRELTAQREDALYQNCLRLCSPEYPSGHVPDYFLEGDPATYVCQSFGSLAETDLARKPYFDVANPHFNEILHWLPSVVSCAAPELVRTEFRRAVNGYERSPQIQSVCERLMPLAACKLGEECRSDVEKLLTRDAPPLPTQMRNAATKALAIIICGRDPLDDALEADRKGEFDSLSAPEQAVLLATCFDGQVRNGHVFQFLFNSSGIRAPETCQALESLGDLVGLRLLKAGISAVMSEGIGSNPHEAARRLPAARRRELEASFEDLYRQYCEQDDITLRIYRWVLAHSEHFKKQPR